MSPALELEVDPVAGRQRVDEVGQELGRDGRRAVGLDLAGHPVGDPDLEVGGGQLEPGVLGLEQDVGQDRQGAPARDGATDDGQAARQVLLHDREFHVGFTPLVGCGSAADRGRGSRSGAGRSRAGVASGRWVSSLYLLTPSSPSSWCGRAWTVALWPCAGRRWTSARSAVDDDRPIGGRGRGRTVDDSEPGRPPAAADRPRRRPVHRRRGLSTAMRRVVHDSGVVHSGTDLHRQGAPWPRAARPRAAASVGVDQLADRGDLAAQLVVDGRPRG